MHNRDGKGGFPPLWMTVLCVVPVLILFFVGRRFYSGGYILPVLVGVCIVTHLWMMFRGHGSGKDNSEEKEVPTEHSDKKKHKHSCCH